MKTIRLTLLALCALLLAHDVDAATANATRSGRAVTVPTALLQVLSATPADGDDLAINTFLFDSALHLVVNVAPATATTTLNSLSSGKYAGQSLELVVTNANTLVVPSSLSNVDFGLAGDQSVLEGHSLTLVWVGSKWRLSSLPGLTATVAEVNAAADISASVETVITTNVITSAECGKTFLLSLAAGFASTLPAPTAGCKLTFFVKTSPTGGAYTIATNGGDNVLIGGVNELEVDTGDDGPRSAVGDLITFVQNAAVVGDFVTLVSDGTSWYLYGQTNADGGVTIGST